jgi:hypothetical protein
MISPTKTASACGGKAQPWGTVVTAEGSVVVVLEEVVGNGGTVGGAGVRMVCVSWRAVTEGAHTANAHTVPRRKTKNCRRTCPTLVIATLSLSAVPRNTATMGFNPTRKRIARNSDIWFVVSAVVVAFALVGWAFFG